MRELSFLDDDPDPKEVPQQVISEIEKNIDLLRSKWDEMYPENPVFSKEDDDE